MTKFNGYTNRETWLVNMHIGGIIIESIEDTFQDYEVTVREIADHIQYTIDDMFFEEIEGLCEFLRDFIDLGKIDYYELAELYIRSYLNWE